MSNALPLIFTHPQSKLNMPSVIIMHIAAVDHPHLLVLPIAPPQNHWPKSNTSAGHSEVSKGMIPVCRSCPRLSNTWLHMVTHLKAKWNTPAAIIRPMAAGTHPCLLILPIEPLRNHWPKYNSSAGHSEAWKRNIPVYRSCPRLSNSCTHTHKQNGTCPYTFVFWFFPLRLYHALYYTCHSRTVLSGNTEK